MLQKIWNGDYPLPVMFWGLFLLVPTVLRVILMVSGFVTIADETNSTGHDVLVIGLMASLLLAYYIFVFIGTWRSASKYSKSKSGFFGSNGVDWGRIAKGAMVILLLTNGITML